MSAAVVPVKSLAASKSRLLPDLSRGDLEALSLAMLEDVLTALLATPALERVAVATPDDRVAETARRLGAEALHGPDPGLNAAIDAAASKLHLGPTTPLLVVLGDVAGARAEDLQALFVECDRMRAEGAERVAVLAPSRDGGTSALLRAPHDAIPSRFGPQSAAAHRAAAEASSTPFASLPLDSLAIDLDRAEDVALFLASEGNGRATRALLERLEWRGH